MVGNDSGLEAVDEMIAAAPPEGRVAIVVALAACLAQLGASMVAETTATPTATPGPDANLSVGETAARLGISPAYTYRNSRVLPFVVRIGRRLVQLTRGRTLEQPEPHDEDRPCLNLVCSST